MPRLSKRRHVLGLLVLAALAACRSTPHPLSAAPLSASGPAGAVDCTEAATPFVGQPMAPQEIEAALIRAEDVTAEELSTTFVTTYSGPCAPLIAESNLGQIRLSNGAVYVFRDGSFVPKDGPLTLFEPSSLGAGQIPEFGDARFIHSEEFEVRRIGGGLERRYVGVWQDGASWIVAEFKVSIGGEVSEPRPLLRSSLPLRSVSFFPSPDTNSGSLYLVREATENEVRVARLSWWHG